MKRFFQKSNNFHPKVLGIVSQESFVRIYDSLRDGAEYGIQLDYKFSLGNAIDQINDYEKLVIQVRKKQSQSTIISSSDNEQVSQDPGTNKKRVNKGIDNSSVKKLLNVLNTRRPNYPEKVSQKLYSGIKTVDDSRLKNDIISQEVIYLGDLLKDASKSIYSYVTLEKPDLTETQKQINDLVLSSGESIDPSNVVEFVNRTFSTFSQYGQTGIDQLNTSNKIINDYLFNGVEKKENENSQTFYRAIRKNGPLLDIPLSVFVSIPVENKDLSLDVFCSLYRRDYSIPDEVLKNEIFMPSLVDEFESLTKFDSAPVVSVTSSGNDHTLMIAFSPTLTSKEKRKIKGYNIYRKSVEQSGVLSEYSLLKSLLLNGETGPLKARFKSSLPLELIRVVPFYVSNIESHVFRDIAVGTGYSILGTLSITTKPVSKDNRKQTQIEVYGLPREARRVELHKRNCDDPGSKFSLIKDAIVDGKQRSIHFYDENPEVGKFEYFVVACIQNTAFGQEEKLLVSNCVVHECVEFDRTKNIKVLLTEASNSVDDLIDPSIEFRITTELTTSESEKITNEIQSQIIEMYKKYFDPQNINDPAIVGNQSLPGVPEYSDLFFHELVRTNINTGEREIFELIGDGVFQDNNSTRSKRNIKPINNQHTYVYQVFTYSRNPIELFKNFVAHGTRIGPESDTREWFYLPYKWLHPKVQRGTLFANDGEGIPIISENESLKPLTHGMTARYDLRGVKDQVSVDQILATRISSSCVKVTWQTKSSTSTGSTVSSPYDSYVVMSVVNGIRKYLGITRSNFIYHDLVTNKNDLEINDYGTIYYVVVPILKQLIIDSPAYSNEIFIQPLGLHNIVKLKNTVLESKIDYQTSNR